MPYVAVVWPLFWKSEQHLSKEQRRCREGVMRGRWQVCKFSCGGGGFRTSAVDGEEAG